MRSSNRSHGGRERHRQVAGSVMMLLGKSRGALMCARESGQRVAGLQIIFLKGRVDLFVLLLNVQMAPTAFRTESKLHGLARTAPPAPHNLAQLCSNFIF